MADAGGTKRPPNRTPHPPSARAVWDRFLIHSHQASGPKPVQNRPLLIKGVGVLVCPLRTATRRFAWPEGVGGPGRSHRIPLASWGHAKKLSYVKLTISGPRAALQPSRSRMFEHCGAQPGVQFRIVTGDLHLSARRGGGRRGAKRTKDARCTGTRCREYRTRSWPKRQGRSNKLRKPTKTIET